MNDLAEMSILAAGGEPLALMDPVSGEFILPSNDPEQVSAYLVRLTKLLQDMPGEKLELETKHTFLDGMYVRELFIPKGTTLVGKIHKQACVNLVTKGDISVLTPTGSARVKAGYTVVSPAGIQKLGFAHEDTVFVNVFRTDETDVEKIEDAIAWESHDAMRLSMDREDYGSFLLEYGLTEQFARLVVEDMRDHIQMPPEFNRFTLKDSPIHGMGLFALGDIDALTDVCPARIGRKRTVAGRMTNHSSAPNCEFVRCDDGLLMRTLRDVPDGEELTVDYRQAAEVNTESGLVPLKEQVCQ